MPDAEPVTPHEHLAEIKRRFLAGEISVEEARADDNFWRRRLVMEWLREQPSPYPKSQRALPRMYRAMLERIRAR